ncbi:hypothetical protein FAZ19_16145 [Sphingobacterium alkalisoli]|uniref:Uncharacterized protein n=1 Tax=Sphingobacterium alkalisoli TaxID=1874115 RepID=A0A4U0GXD4_9SPHI|nr:hypothetical protein [Sphingobacterium alkalisoli]TJY63797.1 hypothetical protein FAZ19_16145 [Sphingobacterium alkalisoli]GGH24830.1 hypothetical protein GCM10011418_33010 [Sphingobacterium alkalisoli]
MNNSTEQMNHLKEISEMIGNAIEQEIDRDNPDELTGKLMELCALQGNASHAYALAEQLYNVKISELVQKPEHAKLSATDKKMLFAGLAKEEIYYLSLNERYIRNLSHSIEALRSALSWKKAEMEQARYQTT